MRNVDVLLPSAQPPPRRAEQAAEEAAGEPGVRPPFSEQHPFGDEAGLRALHERDHRRGREAVRKAAAAAVGQPGRDRSTDSEVSAMCSAETGRRALSAFFPPF